MISGKGQRERSLAFFLILTKNGVIAQSMASGMSADLLERLLIFGTEYV